MRTHVLAVLTAGLVASLGFVACGPTQPKCSTSTCSGCCDAAGTCQAGNSNLACGVSGGLCAPCGALTCSFGVCGTSGTGGGSGGGSGGGGGGGGANTAVQHCLDLTAAQLDFVGRCNYYSPAGVADLRAASEARCRAPGGVWPGVADGRATINASAASQCLTAIAAVTCAAPNQPPICNDIIVGQVAENGACFDTGDCVSSASCDTTQACPGLCTARTPIGQPLVAGRECVRNAQNYGGTCTALVAIGQSCAPTGGSSQRHACVEGASCDMTEVCVSAMATLLQTAGQPCNSSGLECALGLQCLSASCAPLVTAGNACDSARRCQGDLLCNAANVCIARGAAGAVCASNSECRDEAFCNKPTGQPSGVCAARRTTDQTCTASGFECAPSLFCTATSGSGVCKPFGTVGSPCSYAGPALQCGDPTNEHLYCTATLSMATGVCANQKSPGATCLSSSECRSSDCRTGTCARPGYCQDETP